MTLHPHFPLHRSSVARRCTALVCFALYSLSLTGCAAASGAFGRVIDRQIGHQLMISDICVEVDRHDPSRASVATTWDNDTRDQGRANGPAALIRQQARADADRNLRAVIDAMPHHLKSALGEHCTVASLVSLATGDAGRAGATQACANALTDLMNVTGSANPEANARWVHALGLTHRGAADGDGGVARVATALLDFSARLDFSGALVVAVVRVLDSGAESIDRVMTSVPFGSAATAVTRPAFEEMVSMAVVWAIERMILLPGRGDGQVAGVMATSRLQLARQACRAREARAARSSLAEAYLDRIIMGLVSDAATLPDQASTCRQVRGFSRWRCTRRHQRNVRTVGAIAARLEASRLCGDNEPCVDETIQRVGTTALVEPGAGAPAIATNAHMSSHANLEAGNTAALTQTIERAVDWCAGACEPSEIALAGGVILREQIGAGVTVDELRAWLDEEVAAVRRELAELRGDVSELRQELRAYEAQTAYEFQRVTSMLSALSDRTTGVRQSVIDTQLMVSRIDRTDACGDELNRVTQGRAAILSGLGMCVAPTTQRLPEGDRARRILESARVFTTGGAVNPSASCASCPDAHACLVSESDGATVLLRVSFDGLRDVGSELHFDVPMPDTYESGLFRLAQTPQLAARIDALFQQMNAFDVQGHRLRIRSIVGHADHRRTRQDSNIATAIRGALRDAPECSADSLGEGFRGTAGNRELACLRAAEVRDVAIAAGVASNDGIVVDGRVDTGCAASDDACLQSARRVELHLALVQHTRTSSALPTVWGSCIDAR